jgi:hypothetical protein
MTDTKGFSSSYEALIFYKDNTSAILEGGRESEKNANKIISKVFSPLHYTYINQFFGDITIRDMIMELYPSKLYRLGTVDGEGRFVGSSHHIVEKMTPPQQICSVDNFQQLNEDENDTLCQSYSLLNYLILQQKEVRARSIDLLRDVQNIPHRKSEKQILMIRIYLFLLNNKDFLKKLKFLRHPPNKIWNDFFLDTKADEHKIFVSEVTIEEFIMSIKIVLALWMRYGYHYFIRKGRINQISTRNMKSIMTGYTLKGDNLVDLEELYAILGLDAPSSSSSSSSSPAPSSPHPNWKTRKRTRGGKKGPSISKKNKRSKKIYV